MRRSPTVLPALAAIAVAGLGLGAATPAAATRTASPPTASHRANTTETTRAAGSHIGVKPGWGTARIRLKPQKDAYIVGELREGGATAPCTYSGCGTDTGGSVTACNTTSNQWYPVTIGRRMLYVSATCGTPV